jgi:hypothetical protein
MEDLLDKVGRRWMDKMDKYMESRTGVEFERPFG